MFKSVRAFFQQYRQLAVIASLVFATLVCLGLYVLRAVRTHNLAYSFLVWNLFLAWLPLICALVSYNFYRRHACLSWPLVLGSALTWLIFLPNAPYLVTDLMHLQPQPDAPYWYDLILFVAFAWTGFFLGLVSLFLMQEMVRRVAGGTASWVFALGVLGVSSFGIYLGRFLRWNSWDVLVNPLQLLADIFERARHPLAHAQTLVFSALFAFFFLAAYLMLVAMTHFRQEAQEQH